MTGYIAQEGKVVRASSRAELQQISGYKAKYVAAIGGHEPNAFLGIPLVIYPGSPEQKIIGVLKLEDRPLSPHRVTDQFSEDDAHFAEMAARVIATVVYNAQVGDAQIQILASISANYRKHWAAAKKWRRWSRT